MPAYAVYKVPDNAGTVRWTDTPSYLPLLVHVPLAAPQCTVHDTFDREFHLMHAAALQ
jgi:hypothetical protein